MADENLKIHSFPEAETALEEAGRKLSEILAATKQDKLLLCAGGSCLGVLNNVIFEGIDNNLTITVLDERFSGDIKNNNFHALADSDFYAAAKDKGCNFIDTSPMETIDGMADKFKEELKSWRANHPDGKTLATVGIGEDGHIAGIMPYPEDREFFRRTFAETNEWVVGYNAKNKTSIPDRITPTFPFLRMIEHVIVFAAGEKKQPALRQLSNHQGDLAQLPALILWELRDVDAYTDLKM